MSLSAPPCLDKSAKSAQILLLSAALVIVIAGLRAADELLVPLLLSSFIAIVIAPSLMWMQQRGIRMSIAMLTVVCGVSLLGFAMLLLVGTSLDDFARALPKYQQQVVLQTSGNSVLNWLHEHEITNVSDVAQRYLDPQGVIQVVGRLFSHLSSLLTYSFLILLTVIFILLEAYSFPQKLHAIWDDRAPDSFARIEVFLRNMQRYIAIKTGVSLATGLIIGSWLALLGVDYPLLWGMLAFLLNYVPNIGSLIAAVPAVLLALLQLGVPSMVYAALGYVVVNVVMGNVIEPRLMGRQLGLSTLVVFLSLVFWGWVLGPVGMLLSVPLTMSVKIALEGSEDTRWIAILLGSEREAEEAGRPRPPASDTLPSTLDFFDNLPPKP